MPHTAAKDRPSSPSLAHAGKPALKTTPPPCSASRKQHKPFRFSCLEQRAPNGVAVKALRPLTRSGSARGLTPDAYFDAPARIRKLPQTSEKQPAVVLTVPAPSGMNWEGIFQEVLVRCFTDSTANMPLICGNGLTWGLGVRF